MQTLWLAFFIDTVIMCTNNNSKNLEHDYPKIQEKHVNLQVSVRVRARQLGNYSPINRYSGITGDLQCVKAEWNNRPCCRVPPEFHGRLRLIIFNRAEIILRPYLEFHMKVM